MSSSYRDIIYRITNHLRHVEKKTIAMVDTKSDLNTTIAAPHKASTPSLTSSSLSSSSSSTSPSTIHTKPPPTLTKYQWAAIVGKRATEISLGAPVLIDIHDETEARRIAERELREGKIKHMYIKIQYPDGVSRNVPVNDLIANMPSFLE